MSTQKHNLKHLIYLSAATIICILTGCSRAQDLVYINDIQDDVVIHVQDKRPIKLQTGDRLNISVHSRDKELVEMFNITSLGNTGIMGNTSNGSYTVDDKGQIEMPILGSVQVKGLTRLELQNLIKYKLLASKLIRDPIVSVEFVGMQYYTLGEMGKASHEINRDNITLLEAISECGDISMEGRRDKVLVLRTIDGKQTPYRVNLTKTNDVYSSPIYYLQQNDIIYVEPSDRVINSTTPLGDSVRNPMFWVSMFNTAMSFILLFSK